MLGDDYGATLSGRMNTLVGEYWLHSTLPRASLAASRTKSGAEKEHEHVTSNELELVLPTHGCSQRTPGPLYTNLSQQMTYT